MALMKNKPVREGDVIATLEARDIQAQRAEAAAAVEEARTNLRNVTGGTIPQTAAQDEKALRDARATLANARAVYERRCQQRVRRRRALGRRHHPAVDAKQQYDRGLDEENQLRTREAELLTMFQAEEARWQDLIARLDTLVKK